jgi:hypothetical protein
MRETTCFALEVKRPSSLPTVREITDNVEWHRSAKLEALAFDSRINSYSNTAAYDTTTATPCAQNAQDQKLIRLSE